MSITRWSALNTEPISTKFALNIYSRVTKTREIISEYKKINHFWAKTLKNKFLVITNSQDGYNYLANIFVSKKVFGSST